MALRYYFLDTFYSRSSNFLLAEKFLGTQKLFVLRLINSPMTGFKIFENEKELTGFEQKWVGYFEPCKIFHFNFRGIFYGFIGEPHFRSIKFYSENKIIGECRSRGYFPFEKSLDININPLLISYPQQLSPDTDLFIDEVKVYREGILVETRHQTAENLEAFILLDDTSRRSLPK